MSTVTASAGMASAVADNSARLMKSAGQGLFNFFGGLAVLFVLWWAGIELLARNTATSQFASFGPVSALRALAAVWHQGLAQSAIAASAYRLGLGLLIAIASGVPIGILMGRSRAFRELSNAPFQLLRMVSPLCAIIFGSSDFAFSTSRA